MTAHPSTIPGQTGSTSEAHGPFDALKLAQFTDLLRTRVEGLDQAEGRKGLIEAIREALRVFDFALPKPLMDILTEPTDNDASLVDEALQGAPVPIY